jgi:2'-5' RNA ligase
MPRLFVAVDLPGEVVTQLDRLCTGLPATRWLGPEQLHLTLRFIGEVEHPLFYEIGEALASISLRPFELRLRGLGLFPLRGPPHTLWVGVEESAALAQLKRRVDRALAAAGLEPERRKFAPHVTIGRFREPPPRPRLASFIEGRALFRSEPFLVSGFALYSSLLRPEGALHVVEARYDFVSGVMERA